VLGHLASLFVTCGFTCTVPECLASNCCSVFIPAQERIARLALDLCIGQHGRALRFIFLLVFLPPPVTFSAGLRIWTRFRSALRQGVHRSCVSCLLRRSVIFTAQGPVFLGGCFSFVQSWSPWPFSTFCLDLPPPSSVLISLPASICLVCVFFSLGGYRVAPNSSRPRFCSGASTFLCAHVCS
jgi:hypothetical protein